MFILICHDSETFFISVNTQRISIKFARNWPKVNQKKNMVKNFIPPHFRFSILSHSVFSIPSHSFWFCRIFSLSFCIRCFIYSHKPCTNFSQKSMEINKETVHKNFLFWFVGTEYWKLELIIHLNEKYCKYLPPLFYHI